MVGPAAAAQNFSRRLAAGGRARRPALALAEAWGGLTLAYLHGLADQLLDHGAVGRWSICRACGAAAGYRLRRGANGRRSVLPRRRTLLSGRPWRAAARRGGGGARAGDRAERAAATNCLPACSPGAASALTRSRAISSRRCATLMPDPFALRRHGGGDGAARRRGAARRAGRDLRRLRRRRRGERGAAQRISRSLRLRDDRPHSRPRRRGLRPQPRGDGGVRRARRELWSSPSIAAPSATSRSPKRAKLGLDVVVFDHHQAPERLASSARRGRSQPAGRSLRPRPSLRGGRGLYGACGAEPRAARQRLLQRQDRARPPRRDSTSSRWRRSPTSCRSSASTAPSSRAGSR